MWTEVALGSLVTLQRGTTYKSAQLNQPGPVLLGLASIARNGGFRRDALKTYGGDSPEKLLVHPGQVFLSLKDVTQSGDLLGSVARVPLDGAVGRLTQDTVRLDVISEEVDPDFLYLSLLTPTYRTYCRVHATGTTNLGLPREDFLAYPVPLPSLPEQKRIAAALSALTDLIETNHSLVVASRAAAVAVYREASENGREVPFSDVADLVRDGVSSRDIPPGTPYVGLEHFKTGGGGLVGVGNSSVVDSNKSRFQRGDVLYGKLRPYFRKHDRPGFDGVCTTEAWVLRGRQPYGSALVEAIVSDPAFSEFAMQGSGGTRMPRANWKSTSDLLVVVPGEQDLMSLEHRLTNLWEMRVELTTENAELARVRDELLPLLMSGRVRVTEAEEVLTEVSPLEQEVS